MGKLSPKMMQQITVTFELCGGARLTKEHFAVIEAALTDYSEGDISTALQSCMKHVRGKMTIADIVNRIPKPANARPSPEEAWAMLPRSEYETTVWTREMAEAWGTCSHLLNSDEVAARMAFRETYSRLCAEAELRGVEPVWEVSLGTDAASRESAIKEAREKGRLTADQARGYTRALPEPTSKRDPPNQGSTRRPEAADMKAYIEKLKKEMGVKF